MFCQKPRSNAILRKDRKMSPQRYENAIIGSGTGGKNPAWHSRHGIRKDQGEIGGLVWTDQLQTRHVREQLREPFRQRLVLDVERQSVRGQLSARQEFFP
jgi:hypothetical protein